MCVCVCVFVKVGVVVCVLTVESVLVCVCVCLWKWVARGTEGRRDGEGASEKSGEGPAVCDLRRQTVVEVEKQTHSQSMGMCAYSMSEETL